MSDEVAAVPARRVPPAALVLAAGAVLAGALAALAGAGLFFGVAALASIAAVARYPREGALAAALASPLNNLVVVHTPVLDMRFTQVLWLTVVLSALWRWTVRRPIPFTAPPRWLTLLLAALVAWQLLSAAVNGPSTRAMVEITQTAYFAVILWTLAGTFGTLPVATRDRILRFALVAGVVLLAASLAYFALRLEFPFIIDVSSKGGVEFLQPGMTVQEAKTGVTLTRLSSFDLSTVTTASLVTGLLGTGLALGLSATRRLERGWGWALFWASSASLIVTFSRAGWLLAVVVVALISWRAGPRQLVTALCSLVVIGALLVLVPQVRGRLAEFNDPNESSTAVHLEMWERAASFANGSPLVGGGPYSYVERSSRAGVDSPAHNFVLEAAADTGWVGAGIALALVLSLLAFGWRRLRAAPPLAFSLWVGMLAAILMNLTMNGFREEMWWVWAGLMVAVACPPAVVASPDRSTVSRIGKVA